LSRSCSGNPPKLSSQINICRDRIYPPCAFYANGYGESLTDAKYKRIHRPRLRHDFYGAAISRIDIPDNERKNTMPLHVKREDVPERKGVRTGAEGEGSMVSVKGYGNECSLMIASRAPGYHTTPHIHESEQLNYIQEGEIWFFVEEQGFHCKKGDFQRIPGNKVHWAWNRSDKDAVVIEAHAPGRSA